MILSAVERYKMKKKYSKAELMAKAYALTDEIETRAEKLIAEDPSLTDRQAWSLAIQEMAGE
jgi:hypothetical protein